MENLKAWDLKKVQIQNNFLIGAQRPTTQEDNYGNILDRLDLYNIPNILTNGILSDMKNGKGTAYLCGHLVQYMDDSFAVFHGRVRYDIEKEKIQIK